MAVMVPRETVTEHRLDALEKKVDDGFAEVKVEMRDRFDRLEAQTRQMGGRFHHLNMTLIGGFFVMIAALIGLIATQL